MTHVKELEETVYKLAMRSMMKGYGLHHFREEGVPLIIEAVRAADLKRCDNCGKDMRESLCRDCQMLNGLLGIIK